MNKSKKYFLALVVLIFALYSFPAIAEEFQIALASFQVQANAQDFIKLMEKEGFEIEVEEVVINNKKFYRILSSQKHKNRDSAQKELLYIQGSHVLNSQDSNGLWLRSSTQPTVLAAAAPIQTEKPGPPAIQALPPVPSPAPPLVPAQSPAPTVWVPSSPLEQSAQKAYTQREDPSKGLIAGKVLDSLTGQGLSNVDVSLASTSESTISDTDGEYKLQAPVGKTFTLNFKKLGYSLEPQTVEVLPDRPSVIPENRTIANPDMETDTYRIVLSWGEYPRDLDSHLITPSGAHVYFSNKYPLNAGAHLDTDNTRSFGPETITIETQVPGEYLYMVHNYSESPRMAGTEATVKVLNQDGIMHTINIPNEGEGDYWIVGTLDEEGFKLVNVITDLLSDY